VADSPRVDRILGVTRTHYRAPLEVRERVRTKLMARGELQADSASAVPRASPSSPSVGALPGGPRAAGVAKSTAIMFAGATFIAGFWLGGRWPNEVRQETREREAASRASESEASATIPPSAGAASTASVQGPAPEREPMALATPSLTETNTPVVDTTLPHGRAPAARAARSPAAASRAPADSAPRANRRAEAAPPEPVRESAFGEELALLQRAERAIRSGEPELALSFLDDIERRYPQTRFVEERAAARLMARCARREVGSRAEAEKFLSERRTSVYSDRVRALCDLEARGSAWDGKRISGH
jgi:hypothetical protein